MTALLAVAATTSTLTAQTVEADYPLLVDELDTTGNYGALMLRGNPPPAAANGGVCHNGEYEFGGGAWQDLRTPNITGLDTTDFQIELEFNVAALHSNARPILMGGNGWRWIGIYNQSDGTFGIKYNNANLVWSSTTITPGTWHQAVLKCEEPEAELFLDGVLVLQVTTGVLDFGPGDLDFTSTDYSLGRAFDGCIRNLTFLNDTTLGTGTGMGTSYCSPGTPNSVATGGGLMSLSGSTSLADETLVMTASDIPNQPSVFFFSTGDAIAPFGNGFLCGGGGTISRFSPPVVPSGNTVSFNVDFNTFPGNQLASGIEYVWQNWYRDPAAGGANFNLTDAVKLTFAP